MRALRERARRGLRRLAIDVSDGDLRAIAERGYEGAASPDRDQQAQAVGLFLTDSLLETGVFSGACAPGDESGVDVDASQLPKTLAAPQVCAPSSFSDRHSIQIQQMNVATKNG
jgi:hypothetical protein